MGRRKMFISPDIRQTLLGVVSPQKAEYLYISDRFGTKGLKQVLKDGGEQFQDVAALAEQKRDLHYIVVTADKEEEGYMAISLLAGICNEREAGGSWEEAEEELDRNSEWEESCCRIPVIPFGDAVGYCGQDTDFFSPFHNTFQAGQQAGNDFVPYWAGQQSMPVCIKASYSNIGSTGMSDVLASFDTNRQVYILLTKEQQPWMGFGMFGEQNIQDEVNELVLTFTAEEVCVPGKRSVSKYYENVWRQMVRHKGYTLSRRFGTWQFLEAVEKTDQNFSYRQLEKILKYAVRGREKGVLKEEDFAFMDRFTGKKRVMEKKDTRSALERLREDLVGLDQVKEQVEETVQIMKFNQIRQKMGIETGGYHNVHVMLGAPGTAKTTVARLMGEIMEEEELLPGRRFACVNGAELKGMYVGHSAPKTKALFEENDVIVIDEAYSLAGTDGEPDSFSREAMAQLVIELEEHAMDKLVIFAGYGGSDVDERHNKMKEFIDSNPGIKSRINSTFHFASYSPDEMTEIFSKHARLSGYDLPQGYEKMVEEYFQERTGDENFGNGREARSLFEKVTVQMAKRVLGSRVQDSRGPVKTEDVKRCCLEDVCRGIQRAREENRQIAGKNTRRKIGF